MMRLNFRMLYNVGMVVSFKAIWYTLVIPGRVVLTSMLSPFNNIFRP